MRKCDCKRPPPSRRVPRLSAIHVTRAQLAKLAGDAQAMHEQCKKAIAICDDPTCDYAWAKQDAKALLADAAPEPPSTSTPTTPSI